MESVTVESCFWGQTVLGEFTKAGESRIRETATRTATIGARYNLCDFISRNFIVDNAKYEDFNEHLSSVSINPVCAVG